MIKSMHPVIVMAVVLVGGLSLNDASLCQEVGDNQAKDAMASLKASEVAGRRLREAARQGDQNAVKRAIESGVDVNAANQYRLTAIYYAADRGHTEIVELLVAAGAELEIENEPYYRLSPMIMAARKNHAEVVSRLLDAGASCGSWTARWPAMLGFTDVVKVLIEKRPDVFPQEQLGPLLKTAKETKNQTLEAYLLSKGAILPEDDVLEPTAFNILEPNELQRLDGRYASVTDDENTRIWVRNDVAYFGDDFELAAELSQVDDLVFEVAGSQGVTMTVNADLGSGFAIRVPEVDDTAALERMFVRRTAQPTRTAASADVREGQWPRFRGPQGAGIADGLDLPLQFDVPSGEGLAWKTPIPGVGHSSPVIWGDRVFVTTAVPLNDQPTYKLSTQSGFDTHLEKIRYRWLAMCIDLNSGNVVWSTQLSEGTPVARRHVMSSHANCTPAVDASHLVVSLAGQGVFCLSHAGEVIWKKDLGRLAAGWFMDSGYEWGFASSPVIHEERVFVQCDVFEGSFVAALSIQNGDELWRTGRAERSSWGTPLIMDGTPGMDGTLGTQLIANGTNAICSYDVDSGAERWRINGNSEVTVASPVPYQDRVFVMGGYMPIQPIFCVDANSNGDITDSIDSIPWQTEKGGAYCITPLVYRDLLYVLHSNGVLTCREASDGEIVYKKRVAGGRSGDLVASPIAADGHLLIPTSGGDVFVLTADREYTRPIVCPVGEPIMASPAAAEGRLIIRGLHHLYGIGAQ